MGTRLAACPACSRHVRVDEAACPFCGGALPSGFDVGLAPLPLARMSRGALAAYAAAGASRIALASLGCGGLAQSVDAGIDERESAMSKDSGPLQVDAGYGGPPSDAPPGDAPSLHTDAGVVYDGSCPTLVLDPDAAPETCHFTPADVACDATSDCTVYVVQGCSCVAPVVGVNMGSTARCPPLPCPPPPPGGGCPQSGLVTQDCKVVPSTDDVEVSCVGHQCKTFGSP